MKRKMTNNERVDAARLLAVLDRNAIIGVREVAVLLNTTPECVYQASSPARVAKGGVTLKLPPKVESIGRRAGWRHGDIRDLIGHCAADTAAAPPNPKPTSKMGRPRQV